MRAERDFGGKNLKNAAYNSKKGKNTQINIFCGC